MNINQRRVKTQTMFLQNQEIKSAEIVKGCVILREKSSDKSARKSAIIFLASKNFWHTFSDQKLAIKLDEIGEMNYTIEILFSFGFQWSCPFLCTAVQGYLFCRWKSQTWGQKKTLKATSKQLFSVFLNSSVWQARFAGTVKLIQCRWLVSHFRRLKKQIFEKKWKSGFHEFPIIVILTASIRLLCNSRVVTFF